MPLDPFNLLNHRMLGDTILIEAVEPVVETKGGLVDPAQYEDKAEWGKVLAVGEGRVTESGTRIAMDVKVGDIVIFGRYSSYKARVGGKDYLIIRQDDVMSFFR